MLNLPNYIKSDDIVIEVNIIGYKTEGESSVIFLRDGTEIIWAGVIDSYNLNSKNITKEILEQNGYGLENKKINFLSITHPDEDHTKNISDIFDNFVDKNTYILTSDFFDFDKENDIKNIEKIKNEFINIFKKITEDNVDKLFLNRTYGEPGLEHKFLCRGRQIDFKILSLLPTDAQIINKKINQTQSIHKNMYSLFIIIEIGMTQLIFAGDCENDSLRYINYDEVPERIDLLKIPHHGSKTSDNILEWEIRDKELGTGVCTTRIKCGTTSKEILEKYRNYFERVCLTGDVVPENNNSDFGVVKLLYGTKGNFVLKPELFGNAIHVEKIL
ncbi:MAG: hypothetical protein IJO08_03000 [Clostridia bacterium]|nr:hypothetical protein [Clostridia bacterium]